MQCNDMALGTMFANIHLGLSCKNTLKARKSLAFSVFFLSFAF